MGNDTAPVIRKVTNLPKRLYAVGDIHGCPDELAALLRHLEKDEAVSTQDLVLFIGDYIDRGPSSRDVLNILLDFRSRFPDTIFLRGNHEDMLMDHLGLKGRGGEVYLQNGGLEFFRSYSIEPYSPPEMMRSKLPPDHIEFLKGLETAIDLAEFLFVHAGVHPRKALEEQTTEDFFWIRRPFIESVHALQKTVVFGHTPFEDVALDLPFKIGIDTGLVYGNKLSCVELVAGTLYQVDREDSRVIVSDLQDRLGGS